MKKPGESESPSMLLDHRRTTRKKLVDTFDILSTLLGKAINFRQSCVHLLLRQHRAHLLLRQHRAHLWFCLALALDLPGANSGLSGLFGRSFLLLASKGAAAVLCTRYNTPRQTHKVKTPQANSVNQRKKKKKVFGGKNVGD